MTMVVERFGKSLGRFAKSPYFVAAPMVILLLMFGLAVHSMVDKSPTFDEQGFITRGLGYLRGENRHMRVGHPLGLNALNAMFLVGDESVRLPVDDPSWQGTNFHRPSELFLWEIGNDVAHVMFLARLPTVFLGLLLAALAGRWAWELSGKRPLAGVLALFFVALDPNILAHSRLTTTDLGLAAAALAAGYLLWRFFKRPSWKRAALAGIGFGLLQNTKFTAGLFVPLFAVVIIIAFLVHLRKEGGRWRAALKQFGLPFVVAFPAAAFLTLWAAYGFDIGTLPESLPTMSQLSGRTLPLAHHLEQLLDIGGRMQKSTPAFLLGNYSDSGWWYYFPVAFLVKTPLPTLIFLAAAAGLAIWRLFKRQAVGLKLIDAAALLVPAAGYFAIALTSEINLGYRHLLPALPYLVVFGAAVLVPTVEKVKSWRYVLPLLCVWLLAAAGWIAPDFLAFFNVFAGGPDNGWQVLVDSNLDWGQDLQRLKPWMDENGVEEVWLSYFGEARPDYYGIDYRGLASNPPRLMNPLARPFYPDNPAPGIYAISATTLQGVHFNDHDLFAWFRDKEPLDKIGYSLFLYEVAAENNRVDVALGNVQLDEISTADFNQLGTNNIVPRWFDASESLLIMEGERTAVVVPPETVFPEPLAQVVGAFYMPVYNGRSVTILQPVVERPSIAVLLDQDSVNWQNEAAVFAQDGGRITFHGFYLPDQTLIPGGSLVVLTMSEQTADPQPVKMFIHLTAPDGQITAQWDGLGMVWQSWMAGDVLIQQHVLPLPDGLAHGEFQLSAGFYNPNDLTPWQTVNADGAAVDRILLEVLTFQ